MRKFILLFVFALLGMCFTSCDNMKYEEKTGTAMLIGYKVAKHSHIFIKVMETNTIHELGGMGGRREPNIPLGTKFKIRYRVYADGHVRPMVDAYQFGKYPENRRRRYVMLSGYEQYGGY